MEYFRNIIEGLSTTAKGMKITLNHLFGKKVTNQYPDEYHPILSGDIPPNSRNRIFVDMSGCDGCEQCNKACPVNCIEIETVKVAPTDENVPLMNDGKKRKSWVIKHEIDFAKCCFCSLCTEVCPTNAIQMTVEFEYSEYDREKLKYNFSDLTSEQAAEKKRIWEEYQEAKKREQEEKKKLDAEKKANAENISNTDNTINNEDKEKQRELKRLEAERQKAERLAAKQTESNNNLENN